MKRTPSQCPSCDQELAVTGLTCLNCNTDVRGHYRLPPLLRLSPDDQEFVEAFVLTSGSLKAMAGTLGVSYPTVRNRLNDIIDSINQHHDDRDKDEREGVIHERKQVYEKAWDSDLAVPTV